MQRITIETNFLQTIDWFEKKVVDWNSAGTQYSENGEKKQLQKYSFGFHCDNSITSLNGEYVLIFQKLGTKGLLLKNGELLREINRSYYQSDIYEFPAAFFTFKSKTYLIHCPKDYCRIDFEDVETGEIITNSSNRKPHDFFHSRLEVSKDNKYLLSKGWYWHPFDAIQLFDIEKCISDPKQLDSGRTLPNSTTEICSASFIDNNQILLCTTKEELMNDQFKESVPPGHLAIWNIKKDKVSNPVRIKGEYGNLFSINDKKCWDLYKYPKIIDLISGEIVDKLEDVYSGMQNSSIISNFKSLPKIAFNRETKQIAIAKDNKLEILSI